MKKILLFVFVSILSISAFAADPNPYAYDLSASAVDNENFKVTLQYSLNAPATSVKIFCQDEEGNSILRANRPVSFAVEGPAVIVAVDNGDLMETTPYSSHTLPLWHGQASVVIRLTGEAGDIRISACADGITPAALILNAM